MITAADIRAKIASSYQVAAEQGELKRVLFVHTEAERSAAVIVKQWCIEHHVLATLAFGDMEVPTLKQRLRTGKYDFVVISSPKMFKQLGSYYKDGSQEVWRGSVLPPWRSGLSCPCLLITSLLDAQNRQRQHTIPHFKWLLASDLGKILTYKGMYNYRYTICSTDVERTRAWEEAQRAFILVPDIETDLNNLITSIAFTCVHIDTQGFPSIGHTYVLDWTIKSRLVVNYLLTKRLLEETQATKCFHNGCFDMSMLMRHRIGVYNWTLDTEYMYHAWEPELKKSLAFVASVALPDYIYWKSESAENILEYNAKDTINTARILLWMFEQMPAWAWSNYAQMVPLFCPTVMCNLEGFAVDQERLTAARNAAQEVCTNSLKEMQTVLAVPNLNPGSNPQLAHLLYKVYGPVIGWVRPITVGAKKQAQKTGKLTPGTDKISLNQLALKHPLMARFVKLMLVWRGTAKAISTYYNAPLYGATQRLYYTLQLDGTATGRYSCSASIWRFINELGKKGQIIDGGIKNYGTQIQNAPPYYKTALMADPGYLMFNIDKSKSEAHCVALISGDKKFTQAIKDNSRDFYLRLLEWFFGIFTEDKEHDGRQVTKKINHATSYCMGWEVFLDQVGIVKLYLYMQLTNWTGAKDPKTFITHLLDNCFHATFPGIKDWWTRTTKELIETKGYLTTPDGAIRHFFKYPSSPRGIYPAAVAHQPQRLSVVTLNRNLAQVFYEVQLPSKFALRLKGQVHDSLVGQFLEGHEALVHQAKEIMERPYPTSLGNLCIPCDLDKFSVHWKEPKAKKPDAEQLSAVEE